jgi:glycosyltransferase involved in cell wall biosynthesis
VDGANVSILARFRKSMKKKLLFVVNVDWFFLSHRLPIALAAIEQGYEVHLACADTGKKSELDKYGIHTHRLPLERGKVGVLNTFLVFFLLIKLYSSLRPDLLHLVTIKPVLIGGLAARLVGITRVVAAISGLGFVFTAQGFLARGRRGLVGLIYRCALCRAGTIAVVQNRDDQLYIHKVVNLPLRQIILIPGSGVDLNEYRMRPEPVSNPMVLFAARLLRDKGVVEFCEAARILSSLGIEARFCVVGEVDPDNPSSLSHEDSERLVLEYGVELLGYRSDMADTLSQANIVVLPSYREGLPKVLVEAAACGRAVITTDVPGCRDAIVPGETGLLVPVKNSQDLALAIHDLISDPQKRYRLGMAGRRLAEQKFDIHLIVQSHLMLYQRLMAAL